jgi:hypothetical protein
MNIMGGGEGSRWEEKADRYVGEWGGLDSVSESVKLVRPKVPGVRDGTVGRYEGRTGRMVNSVEIFCEQN